MNQDRTDSSFEPPIMPPVAEAEADAAKGLLRWAVAAIILIALVIGAYWAYASLARGGASDRAAAEASRAASTDAGSDSGDDGGGGQTMAQPSASANEPAAPAVAGGAVNKCMAGERIIYTNTPCPEGSRLVATDPPDDAAPSPAQPAALSGAPDAGQQKATCDYLMAETTRLDYEFQQPLPPAVLDHISTLLANLRAQTEDARCATLQPAKAASSAASAPGRPRAPARPKSEDDQVEEQAD